MEKSLRKKDLFIGYRDKFFQEVINNLSANIDICQLLSSPSADKKINTEEGIYFKYLQRPEDIQQHYADFLNDGIDSVTLEKLYECRVFFNRTLDRIFLNPLTNRQADQYFFTLVEFWFSYFNKSPRIKTIFFEASPHFPWDVCMFFIAKHLNIKTYILRRTLINDCILFDEDFRMNKQRIVRFEKSFTGGFEIDDLLALYKKESVWRKTSIDNQVNISKAKNSSLYLLPYRVVARIKIIFNEISNAKGQYFKLSKYYYFTFIIKRFFQQRRLLKNWEENTKDIPSDAPFVYITLHFQPERSTDPEAGIFSQQILAIKLLLKILPEDWYIVVKEHPRQNISEWPNLRRLHYRSHENYQEIFKLPRVIPVSVNTPSAELISSCSLIASCTGSVLWEALLQGKPSIAFSATWHSDCKSSPSIYDIEANPLILNQLLTKDKSEVLEDMEDFLKKNFSMFVNASNSDEYKQQSKLSDKLLISNLSGAIDYIIENDS